MTEDQVRRNELINTTIRNLSEEQTVQIVNGLLAISQYDAEWIAGFEMAIRNDVVETLPEHKQHILQAFEFMDKLEDLLEKDRLCRN